MFILRFINDDDDLSVKEFTNLSEVKDYINQNNLKKTWHQIEEIKNLKAIEKTKEKTRIIVLNKNDLTRNLLLPADLNNVVETNTNDFTVDGLRFNVFTDFS